ncbi:MAG: amino acid ABC transporter substrate-binding protein [Deltaproteobacteria bacterium]|nr:amino acid ABC transporter substrate-binding protein [Deltaproteobacteria bacterium]MBW1962430.1 amino acid ABC transporter substrate-binding protein [Deltaproteobacteria bacterium]MBW2153393.1 amino acid ABC transporter substrate-binding protein [Deltaproteobacteria bacterium]
MKTIVSITIAVLVVLLAASAPAFAGATLDAVRARGKVICGANGNRAGFSALDSKGRWKGMDCDTCRAIAAAVLGDSEKVQFLKTTTQTRFTALQTGEVDVLTRNVTWTLSRDSKLGVDFVAPTFYDGQGFMVSKKLGVKSVKELDGASVCVLPGSTSEKVAADVFRTYGMSYTPVVIESKKELNTAFFSGRCDVHVQSTSGLSSARATVAPNPDDYIILPGVYGKDPMGPVVRQDDPQWRDIVAWTVYAMIEAEESGVTSKNVDEMRKSKDPNIARLLGTKGSLGESLGLDNDWAYRIIKQVGNYGEVFDRNVGKDSPLKLERGLNDLWTRGGLLYSPPFK